MWIQEFLEGIFYHLWGRVAIQRFLLITREVVEKILVNFFEG